MYGCSAIAGVDNKVANMLPAKMNDDNLFIRGFYLAVQRMNLANRAQI
jgi:hypothetical protein